MRRQAWWMWVGSVPVVILVEQTGNVVAACATVAICASFVGIANMRDAH